LVLSPVVPATRGRFQDSSPARSLAPSREQAARLLHPSRPLDPVPLPIDTLVTIAGGLARTAHPSALESGSPRAFRRLLETPSYEAWLIAWEPATSLELHDHGGSVGVVWVVAGRLVETYTDLTTRWELCSQELDPGDVLAVPASRVHQVWNPYRSRALSVHVYSPPLSTMTFFDHRPEHYLDPLRTSAVTR
jgi:hypothetical protein